MKAFECIMIMIIIIIVIINVIIGAVVAQSIENKTGKVFL